MISRGAWRPQIPGSLNEPASARAGWPIRGTARRTLVFAQPIALWPTPAWIRRRWTWSCAPPSLPTRSCRPRLRAWPSRSAPSTRAPATCPPAAPVSSTPSPWPPAWWRPVSTIRSWWSAPRSSLGSWTGTIAPRRCFSGMPPARCWSPQRPVHHGYWGSIWATTARSLPAQRPRRRIPAPGQSRHRRRPPALHADAGEGRLSVRH